MSDQNQAVEVTAGRSRDYRKIALSIALLLAAATALIGGAFATFTDSVTAGPQAITSGTIKLAVGPVNDVATGATNIAAGDWISREADLNSGGATIANKEITLKFSAPVTKSLLDEDPNNGLQVSVKACTVAWTKVKVGEYTCSGSATEVKIGGAATAAVGTLESTPGALTPLNSLATGGQDYLVFTLTLPSTAPGNLGEVPTPCSGALNGNEKTENLEGCKSTLTYTFQATQRAAIAQ
jgi:predicted ribosomally synthesized peptide with SipW-like signal peptide